MHQQEIDRLARQGLNRLACPRGAASDPCFSRDRLGDDAESFGQRHKAAKDLFGVAIARSAVSRVRIPALEARRRIASTSAAGTRPRVLEMP